MSRTLSDGSNSFSYNTFERQEEISRIMAAMEERQNESVSLLEKTPTRKTLNRFEIALVLFACLFLYLAVFGMFVALGVVYVVLPDTFDCSKSEAALVQSLYIGFALAGSVVTNFFVLRCDAGFCVMIASLVGTIAFSFCMLATSVAAVILLIGVISGIASSVFLIASSVTISCTFTKNRRFALGMTSLGSSVGMIITPYISSTLLETYSWNGCILLLGAILMLHCLPCGLIIYCARKSSVIDTGAKAKTPFWTLATLKDVPLMIYFITAFIYNLFALVGQMFVVDFAVVKDLSIEQGTVVLSMNGLFGLLGRLVSVATLYVRPGISASLVAAISFLLCGLTFYALGTTRVFWVMILAMGAQGFFTSVVIAFLPAFMITLKDVESFPYMLAMTNLMSGVAQAIAGYVGGFTYDVTHSYTIIFNLAAIVIVCCSISICSIYWMHKRRRKY